MEVNDRFHQRQSQACPLATSGRIDPIKSVEHLGDVLRGYAAPRICHDNFRRLSICRKRNSDAAALGSKADGIVHEVADGATAAMDRVLGEE